MEQGNYPQMYLYKRIVMAKLFIDEHYSGSVNVMAVASEACFSKFHFIRLFKKTYGFTINQYLTVVRIRAAQELLIAGNRVEDVCRNVGFESVSSFTILFKKRTGLSPLGWLKKERQRLQEQSLKPLHFVPGCFSSTFDMNKESNIR